MRIPRPVWLLGLVSLFTDIASEMVYPLLPTFLSVTLGAGAGALGVIEGIAESTASLLKLVSGYWSDRVKKRKPFVVFGYLLSTLFRPLIGIAQAWPHVLLFRFGDRVGKGLRTAPRDAMLVTLATSDNRGKIFGFHRSMDHFGAILGPLIAMLFLWHWPGEYRTLFLATAIPGLFAVFTVFQISEIEPTSPAGSLSTLPFHVQWRELNPLLRQYLKVLFLFALGNSSDAFLLLRLSQAGVESRYLPLAWTGLHIVKSSTTMAGGILSDRIGRKTVLTLGWFWFALVYLGFAFMEGRVALVLLFLAYGLYYGLTEGAERAFVADVSKAGETAFAFGAYNALIGAAALPASLLFGALWTWKGYSAAFLVGAVLAVLGAFFLWRLPVRNSE